MRATYSQCTGSHNNLQPCCLTMKGSWMDIGKESKSNLTAVTASCYQKTLWKISREPLGRHRGWYLNKTNSGKGKTQGPCKIRRLASNLRPLTFRRDKAFSLSLSMQDTRRGSSSKWLQQPCYMLYCKRVLKRKYWPSKYLLICIT